ncbi:unnamed protein product [marine sediment metagenome]|uniref:Uncharacterized protein n=1 Tax=marine sediment metagenome TaxID=412755 RepID=X1UJP7_9ZZZZ
MTWTWWDIGLFFVVIVVGSLVAGFIETWLEQRRWSKEQRQRDKKGGG